MNQYLAQQVNTATPAERIVLAYDGIIRFLLKAKAAIEAKDIKTRYESNKRAADIISYLADTLDAEQGGEIAARLLKIYKHCLIKLIDVDLKNDAAAIDEVMVHMRTLRSAWEKIARGQTPDATAATTAPVDATSTEPTALAPTAPAPAVPVPSAPQNPYAAAAKAASPYSAATPDSLPRRSAIA